MSSRELFTLEPGDTGEAILPAFGEPAHSAASGAQAYPEPCCAHDETHHFGTMGCCTALVVDADGYGANCPCGSRSEADKVNGKGVHAVPHSDRDGSEDSSASAEVETSRGSHPSTNMPATRDAEDTIAELRAEVEQHLAYIKHEGESFAQLRDEWFQSSEALVRKVSTLEARLARVEALADDYDRVIPGSGAAQSIRDALAEP